MKLNEEKSLFVDTRYFFFLAANFDVIMKSWEDHQFLTDENRERFEEIQKSVGLVPEWMSFLFRGKEHEQLSFVSTYTEGKLDEFSSSPNYMLSVMERQDKFFEALADYYIPDAEGYMKSRLIERDIDAWYRESERREVETSDRLQLLYLCDHYDILVHTAQELWIRTYHAVKNMHEKMADTIRETMRRLQQKDVQEELRKFAASDFDSEDYVLGITLLNPYIIASWGNKENRIVELFVGDHFEEVFQYAARANQDFKHFVVACGSQYKIEAVSLIMKNGRMTLSQLAEAMGTQSAIIIRPMTTLVDEGILRREKKEGRNVYYSINEETFRKAKRSAMEFWNWDFGGRENL